MNVGRSDSYECMGLGRSHELPRYYTAHEIFVIKGNA